MITKFIMEHECMSSILLLGLVSILLQAMVTLSLKGYVRASANMKTTKKKIMLNLKNQFETIYEMNYQVRNVSAYVEKYLLKLRFMGLSYATWEKSSFLAAGVVTLVAGGEAFLVYRKSEPTMALVEILFAYGVVLACLFLFFHIFGLKNKKQQIQIQLVDYLENYLANRLLRSQEGDKDVRMLNESMEQAFIEGSARNENLKQVILQENREPQLETAAVRETEDEEDIMMLRQMLKESDVEKEEKQPEKKVEKEDPELALLEEFVQSFLA